MLEKIKKIFKKKTKAKPKKVKEVLTLDEDKTFENEIKKPEVKEIKETASETKSETKSSLTFGV
mgnify:FL=1